MKVDEFVEKTTKERNKELEDYRRFIFIDTIPNTSINKRTILVEPNSITEQETIPTESQEPEPQIESTESQSMATELEPEDINANHSIGKEPMLARYVRKHHTPNQIIGDKSEGTMTRRKLKGTCLLAEFEPRSVKYSLKNKIRIESMNEEIEQIKNKTWTLVPKPKDKNVIGTKWVFKNKLNEDGKVSRNKARLVCKGYSQQEWK